MYNITDTSVQTDSPGIHFVHTFDPKNYDHNNIIIVISANCNDYDILLVTAGPSTFSSV